MKGEVSKSHRHQEVRSCHLDQSRGLCESGLWFQENSPRLPQATRSELRGAGHCGPVAPSFHFLPVCFAVRRVPGAGWWKLG